MGEGIVTSRVDWEPEPVTTTADEALAADGKSNTGPRSRKRRTSCETLLADGPVPSKQVEAEAEEAGIAS